MFNLTETRGVNNILFLFYWINLQVKAGVLAVFHARPQLNVINERRETEET